MDLSKVFDAIDHSLLLAKLKAYGLPVRCMFSFNKDLPALSSWFESNYLTVNSAKTQALSDLLDPVPIIILYFLIMLK